MHSFNLTEGGRMKTTWMLAACGALLSLHAAAGQMCGKQRVADNVRTCPNGDIPMFVADERRRGSPGARAAAAPPSG
ncbi:hypothetical protein, partial [Ralstonia sp. RL]|uniref:hypothetical protein n=1 Tax=Ralstonia sp. RL TaxID=1839756 RepID=UPI00257B1429